MATMTVRVNPAIIVRVNPGPMLWFSKYFRQTFLQKWRFFVQATAIFCKICTITLVIRKTPNFSQKFGKKSQKIGKKSQKIDKKSQKFVIITSIPIMKHFQAPTTANFRSSTQSLATATGTRAGSGNTRRTSRRPRPPSIR
jgi:hypothetical protein